MKYWKCGSNVPVKFNFSSDRERFISEISQTACQLLCWTIFLMIVGFCSIIDHCHNVRIVMLVVIVKRIKKYSKTIPPIRTSKNWAFESLGRCIPKERNGVDTSISKSFWHKTYFWHCLPECQTISTDSTSTSNTELNFNFPPIEACHQSTPNHAFLASQWRCYPNTFFTSNGI